jgi:hypothetical protein
MRQWKVVRGTEGLEERLGDRRRIIGRRAADADARRARRVVRVAR